MKILALPRDANPYQELLYRELRSTGDEVAYLKGATRSHTLNLLLMPVALAIHRLRGFEVLHLHWVFGFRLTWAANVPIARRIAQVWFELNLRWIKALGYRLVWTAHNLLPHEPIFADDEAARRTLIGHCDAVIALNEASLHALEALGVGSPALIPQGPYRSFDGETDRSEVRRRLGVAEDDFLVLFTGLIAPYKGADLLLEAVAGLPSGSPVRVLVAGSCNDAGLKQRLQELAQSCGDRAILRLEWIPDDEIGGLLAAADAAAFPFRQVSNSSSVMFAMGAGLPVVIPDLPELAGLPGDAVLRYEPAPGALLQALGELASMPSGRLATMGEAGRTFSGSFSWVEAANRTREVFERTLEDPAGSVPKILMVAPYPPARDGIGSHARSLVAELEADHEVAVLTRRGSGPEGEQGVHRLLAGSPACLPAVLKAVKQEEPEVIHYQFAIPALGTAVVWGLSAGVWARLTRGSKIVVTMHEVRRELAALRGAGVLVYRLLGAWADRCIVYTRENRDLLVERCRVDPGKVVVMPHGVPPGPPAEPAARVFEELRHRYWLGDGPVVLSFGYVHPHKGTEHLIEALHVLRECRPEITHDLTVLVAGAVRPRKGIFKYFERQDVRYQSKIESMVEAAGLDDVVRFAGFVPQADVYPLFRLAAFAACPYTNISQSGVVNLAISAGTPVLAGDLPGLRENLENGGGIFAPPGDAAALAEGIESLLEDGELRARLTRRQEAAREEMSFAVIARRLTEIYRTLTAGVGARVG